MALGGGGSAIPANLSFGEAERLDLGRLPELEHPPTPGLRRRLASAASAR